MEFGEMLDWALRLRAFGALRAWVGARGPVRGIGAMRCVARGFWRVVVSESPSVGSREAAIWIDYPKWVIIC